MQEKEEGRRELEIFQRRKLFERKKLEICSKRLVQQESVPTVNDNVQDKNGNLTENEE